VLHFVEAVEQDDESSRLIKLVKETEIVTPDAWTAGEYLARKSLERLLVHNLAQRN
jgi:hypothetical protein